MPTYSSVAIDITNNYGGTSAGIRSVEFYLNDTLIPVSLALGDNCNQSSILSTYYHSKYAFFGYTKTGTSYMRQWQSATGSTTNQRIVVWFHTPTEFDKIVINNAHSSGGSTTIGAKDVKIYGSPLTAMNQYYGGDLSGSSLLFDGTLLEHVATDTVDPQVVYEYVALPDIDIDVNIETLPPEISGITFNDGLPEGTIRAKSVVFDFADAYGPTKLGIRSIDFYLNNVLIEVTEDDFTAGATSEADSWGLAKNAFITALPKAGMVLQNGWDSLYPDNYTNQRLYIEFDTSIVFDKIIVNNYNNNGVLNAWTYGAKNTKITTSLEGGISPVYNATVPGGEVLIENIVLRAHESYNCVDEQVIYDEGPVSPPRYRSISVDIADNWGGIRVGIRSIDFYWDDELVSVLSGYYISYFYQWLSENYNGLYTFRTDVSKTGSAYQRQYLSNNTPGPLRLVLSSINDEPMIFNRIVINNSHNYGGEVNQGAKNIKIIASPRQTKSYVYDEAVTEGVVLFDGQIPPHVASDIEDPIEVYNVSMMTRLIDVNIVTQCEITGVTQLILPVVDIDIDTEVLSPPILLSATAVNSAPFPNTFLLQSKYYSDIHAFYDQAGDVPITYEGNVWHAPIPSLFGYSSIYTEKGESHILAGPSDTAFSFGTGDYTVHFQLRLTNAGWDEGARILTFYNIRDSIDELPYIVAVSGPEMYLNIAFMGPSSRPNEYDGLGALKNFGTGNWYHLAYVRKDGVLSFYVQGLLIDSCIDTTNYTATKLRFGNIRANFGIITVSKYAIWEGPFTPPVEVPEVPWVFKTNFNATPQITSFVSSEVPSRIFVSGQPWADQRVFNDIATPAISEAYPAAEFPVTIERASTAVLQNKAYVFGGRRSTSSGQPSFGGTISEVTTTFIGNIIRVTTIDENGDIGTWSTYDKVLPFTDFVGGHVLATQSRLFLFHGINIYAAWLDGNGGFGNFFYYGTTPISTTNSAMVVIKSKVNFIGASAGILTGLIDQGGAIDGWYTTDNNITESRSLVTAVATETKVYLMGNGPTLMSDVSAEGFILGNWTDAPSGFTDFIDDHSLDESLDYKPHFVQTQEGLFLLGGERAYTAVLDENNVYPSLSSSLALYKLNPLVADVPNEYGHSWKDFTTFALHTVFATKSKIYMIGGQRHYYQETPDFSDWWWEPNSTDEVTVIPFTGKAQPSIMRDAVSVLGSVPAGIFVKHSPKTPEIQSYFGYGSLAIGDVVAPVPVIEAVTLHSEFINVEVEAPAPVIESVVHFFRYINTEFVAPLPEIYSSSGIMISGGVAAPVPDVRSYVVRSAFMTDFRTQPPVISASVSNPIAINGDFKAIHPHFNSTFQTLVNFHAPAPTINAVTANPYAIRGDYGVKPPAINSIFSNPELINASIEPKVAKVQGLAVGGAYITANFESKRPMIFSYASEVEGLVVKIDSARVVINATVNNPIQISASIRAGAPVISSSAMATYGIIGNFVQKLPSIHGEFLMTDDYVVVKHRENRLCRR